MDEKCKFLVQVIGKYQLITGKINLIPSEN